MNSLKVVSLSVIGATVVGLGLGLAPAEAATVFTNEAAFLSNVQSGSYLENFNGLSTFAALPSSITFSQGGFSYTASAPGGNLYAAPTSNPGISVLQFGIPLTFTFTSGNISAVGGAFFTAFGGNPVPGSVTLALSDGTTQTLTNTNNSSFLGFIADPGSFFTSLTVTASGNNAYPYADNLRVGTATPVPTPALLPGLIGLGLGVLRKRQTASAKANG